MGLESLILTLECLSPECLGIAAFMMQLRPVNV